MVTVEEKSFSTLIVLQEDSLDSIQSPSPSVKIQIMSGEVGLRCKGKTLLGVINKLLKTQQCFPLLPQINFLAKN